MSLLHNGAFDFFQCCFALFYYYTVFKHVMFSNIRYPYFLIVYTLKINKSRYTALFVVNGSIKKHLSIDYGSIYLFSIFFFNRFCLVGKCWVTLHHLYRNSLTVVSISQKIVKRILMIN